MSQLPNANNMKHFENLQPSSAVNIPSQTPLPTNNVPVNQFSGQQPQINGQQPQFNPLNYHQQYMIQNQKTGSSFSFSSIINFGKKHMYLIVGLILLGAIGYYIYTKKYRKQDIQKQNTSINQRQNIQQQQPHFDLDYNTKRELENTELEIDDKELEQNLTQEEMEEIQRQLHQSQRNNNNQLMMET